MKKRAQIATRALCLLIALHATSAKATSQGLSLEKIISIVRHQSPAVASAKARLQEAKAGRTGIKLPAYTNPYLSLTAGPGYSRPPQADFEFMLNLQWPLDFTSARTGRSDVANERVTQAIAEYEGTIREQVMVATTLAVKMAVAHERYVLCVRRSELDQQLLHTALIRQSAGTAADADVALAKISLAQSQVLANNAAAENSNLMVAFAFQLGMPSYSALPLTPDFLLPLLPKSDEPNHAALADLLALLTSRPDTRAAMATQAAAEADVRLQTSLGVPIPSIALAAGRGPEYQFSGGVGVPVPVYQRNQNNRAVSKAHAETTRVALDIVTRSAEAQLRSLHINYHLARQTFAIMADVFESITQAEHLALRGFELGQDNLTQALLSRRETMQARAVYLESKAAAAQAFVALQVALGAYDGP
jgi:outer membrane protein TolC